MTDTTGDTATYRVNEIFYSLQGEGCHTGTPATFVRLCGCNLRCPFCDTHHDTGAPMTARDIAAAVSAHPANTVIITGGEPSLWPLGPLVDALHHAGKTVHIETNGTNPVPDTIDWITCSPKQISGTRDTHHVRLTRIDELKIVYTADAPQPGDADLDLEHTADTLAPLMTATRLYLQPCSNRNTPHVIAYILAHPRWRLSLQTHLLTGIR